MKKVSIISTVAISLLLGVSGLQAEEVKAEKAVMPDKVVKEESAGLKAGNVKGEAAAQAAVEEVNSKEALKVKEAASTFKKESEADVKKLNGNKAEVKVLEEVVAKDKGK